MSDDVLSSIQIRRRKGSEVAELVDALYAAHGSSAKARPDDLFFLAFFNDDLIGCVRFCIEENVPLLRTMRIADSWKRKKIGLALLKDFAAYLDSEKISNVFCLPYSHLPGFYGNIGFEMVSEKETPLFLLERLKGYKAKGLDCLIMRRR